MRKGLWLTPLAAMLLVLTLGAGTASADSISFTLNNSNVAPTLGTGYVQVTVNRTDSTHATVTMTTIGFSGLTIFGAQAFDLNVSGSFSAGSLVGFTAPTNISSGNADGFGNFNLTVDNHDGPTDGNTTMSLVLTATGGNSWATAGSVLTANANGSTAAAHLAYTSTCTGWASNGTTSSQPPAGTPPCGGTSVPEPNSLVMLLAAGCLGALALFGRRVLV